MLKAVSRSVEAPENIEEMRGLTSRITAINNLEKRMKAKGKPTGAFTERKKELLKNLEEVRRR